MNKYNGIFQFVLSGVSPHKEEGNLIEAVAAKFIWH